MHAVLREDEPEAIQQVEQAPRQIFAALPILDLSPGGAQALESALEEYDLQMDALEERLARLLRDKLQACKVRVCGFLTSCVLERNQLHHGLTFSFYNCF